MRNDGLCLTCHDPVESHRKDFCSDACEALEGLPTDIDGEEYFPPLPPVLDNPHKALLTVLLERKRIITSLLDAYFGK